jgi:hypothetical protein
MTASTLTFRGRLPGVDCDPALPAVDQPIRLDVAGFVGLAERGPLDLPVAVEDAAQYASVFGGDLAVAQDGGVPVYAQLPTAVRAFFDNGGRRCYVVRVAGPHAGPSRWTVPGLEVWQPDGSARPAAVAAAWPGAWSNHTSVTAVLLTRHLSVIGDLEPPTTRAAGRLPLLPGTASLLRTGDLLRIDLAAGQGLFARVRGFTADGSGSWVLLDQGVGFEAGDGVSSAELVPVALPAAAALGPADPRPALPVVSVQRLRLDLVVSERTPSGSRTLDRIPDLSFGGDATGTSPDAWYERLQPADDRSAPDPSRSMGLRQDGPTMQALATGLAVPVGMARTQAPAPAAANEAGPPPLAIGRDDLAAFDPAWFVDADLARDTVFSLVGHADQLTVLTRTPRTLRGMHGFLAIDEVAMVALPDVTHRGWFPAPVPLDEPPPQPPQPLPVDWSHFRCCADRPVGVVAPEPVITPTPPSDLPDLYPPAGYDVGPLLDTQVALLTMCAARADQVALLSLPSHFGVADVLDWRDRVAATGRVADGGASGTPPLSYGGYWHPWASQVTGRVGTRPVLRDVPPDGPVAGMIAARELARGSWIAPAGVPLHGVVRLTPTLTTADQVHLFDAHANLLVPAPGTFSALSAHTLSSDPQLLHLSVRRLLILLRKIAVRLGARYTFEVNNDRFRQLVRMRFDRILARLQERGAVHAFRVLTDGGVNTEEDQANGRFVLTLQIAPSNPVEFITVTLVRSGDGLLDVLEG